MLKIAIQDVATGITATVKDAGEQATADDRAVVVTFPPTQASIPVTIQSPTTSSPALVFGDVSLSSVTTSPIERTVYTEQTTNFTGSVVSSSANDAAAGTGARTVAIYYVDATGSSAGVETVILSGTTPQNLTVPTKCFIEKMVVATAGSGGVAAGTITLKTGSAGAGTTVGTIGAGDTQTWWAHHYVVTGKTCNITDVTHSNTSTVSGGNSTSFLRSLVNGGSVEQNLTGAVSVGGANDPFTEQYGSTIRVTGPSRIRMYVTSFSASSIVYAGKFNFYDE